MIKYPFLHTRKMTTNNESLIKNGKHILYYDNGNIHIDGFWNNNTLLKSIEYYDNKKLKFQGNYYEDNVRHGDFITNMVNYIMKV